ncbi:MAG: hypothetical protein D6809_02490 [Gammaproteobacteria bacterium]|nr:MAG: hypothetical protein D6809_02490 [Gammaproteobacteria bacterium]
MTRDPRLFSELLHVLRGLQALLETHGHELREGLRTVAAVAPQVRHTVDSLVHLAEHLRHTVEGLEPARIPHVHVLADLSQRLHELMDSAAWLLPEEPALVEEARASARLLGDLPALGEVRGELLGTLDAVTQRLRELRP